MKVLIKRKNFYLDEMKLKRAKKLLQVKTATEAIDRALDLVTFQKDILESLKKVKAKGHVGHL
ncbi:MAG: hypothetical protein HYU97_05900 [Deltaproteobacteria bacterium]|nr:hypothetical protein [Deltaproteobacteria bacterium]